MSRVVALLAVVMAALTSGCAVAGSDGTRQRQLTRQLTPVELVEIQRAEGLLVAECMQRSGFKYWVLPPPNPDDERSFPYVVDDPEWARKHGYGIQLGVKAKRQMGRSPNIKYLEQLTPERRTAALKAYRGSGDAYVEVTVPGGATIGRNSGGCLAEAQRTLYGDFPVWVRVNAIGGNLSSQYQANVENDTRYREAVKAWSGCMADAKLPYVSPRQIQQELPNLLRNVSPEQAWTTEVRLAVAEATCARSTPLSRTAKELDSQYGDPVRRTYAREIAMKNRLQAGALLRAQKVILSAS